MNEKSRIEMWVDLILYTHRCEKWFQLNFLYGKSHIVYNEKIMYNDKRFLITIIEPFSVVVCLGTRWIA